uniref:Carboxylic ester hydrolase n=1 Tax=uncultured bacterium Contig1514 TaxID=1393445 RepID=W0FJM8_9BACT|nr:carboxylesterase type b [uncultured bacterium Contig1514]
MKRFLLVALLAAVLLPVALVSTVSCGNSSSGQKDTLVINTTEFGQDVQGRNGPTPVEITVVKGVITSIKALPSREGGRYLKMIEDAGLLDKLNGLTLEEAKQVQLDAVSGATMSSNGLIGNIKLGLEDGGAYERNQPKVITEAKVKQGKVQGYRDRGLGTFMGIPFAEAPVGDLRWKAPVPKKTWTGVFDATKPGPIPPQRARSFPGGPAANIGENCLYVNIQTPAVKKNEKLPVLVWIHGGGFIDGDANQNDGVNFAKQGIVYVSLSYRTGALGFLALPELSAENERGISGNYGLLDMVEGLKWVKENIAQFGGDPAKVTIMGESAGAIAVSMLCASPLAKGLFRGAISESGGNFCPVDSVRFDNNGIRDVPGAEAFGVEFMHRMGAHSLAEMRAMDWNKWVDDAPSTGVGGFWPTVDGYVLPDDQYKMYEAGNYNDVNVLIGTNSDEGAMFSRPTELAKYQEDIKAEYGPFADRMLALYPATSDEETFGALSDIFRETAFAWPTWAWAKLQQKTGKGQVYLYYFDQFNENGGGMFGGGPGRKPRGANHASEMSYVFASSWGRPFQGGDKAVSDAMHNYWVNFVKTGNPNGEGLDNWPVYKDGEKTVMFFKNGTSLIETPNKPQLELMEEYFAWKRSLPVR